MSSNISSDNLCANFDTSLPSSSISVAASTQEKNSAHRSDLEIYKDEKRAVLRQLIRYVMRTFYVIPESLVVEYIYHYECINLKDLADRLYLNPKDAYGYIQKFKRDKYIKENNRGKEKVGARSKFNPEELYYEINIETFVNVVKYRLINMQSAIEKFEQEQTIKQKNFKCEQCLTEYTEFDSQKLYRDSAGGDLLCTRCKGIINENNETTSGTEEIVDVRLFNEQFELLFGILKKIDEIMANEHSTTVNYDTEFIIERNNDDVDLPNINESKPLPEWFRRSTVHIEPDDEVDHRKSLLNNTTPTSTIVFPRLNSILSNINNSPTSSYLSQSLNLNTNIIENMDSDDTDSS